MESVSISEEKKCVCIMEVLAAVFSMVCVCAFLCINTEVYE